MFKVSIQDVLQSRSVEVVWFLLSCLNTFSILLFWIAAINHKSVTGSISVPQIQLYYLLLLFAGQTLMSHVEESVSRYDIKEGGLSKFLLRPISYFWFRYWTELPWRFAGGIMSVASFIVFSFIFHIGLPIPPLATVPLLLLLLISTNVLAFTYKMLLSLPTFWITDSWALFEVMEVIVIIMSGFLMPLSFFPDIMQRLAYSLPFAYMVFVPVQAMLGQLSLIQMVQGFGMQLFWIAVLGLTYRFVWKKGISLYTGVGM